MPTKKSDSKLKKANEGSSSNQSERNRKSDKKRRAKTGKES